MKFPLLFLAAALPLKGQIYADIAISHGSTSLGTITITLEHEKTPRIVANFIGLAMGTRPWVDPTTGTIMENTPYYDGQIFHRLDHGFVIQGGDPTGTGSSGPGFVVQDEYHPTLRHSGRYIVSCAKTSQPNTTGSQFFITFRAASNLDDKHSVFGTVTSGQSIIDGFTNVANFPTERTEDPGAIPPKPEKPITDITMDTVTIYGPDLAGFDINDPAHRLPHVKHLTPDIAYDPDTDTFTPSYPREAQHTYQLLYSFDLESWTHFRYTLSLDADPDFTFPITGVNFERFFARVADVDYSQLYNPPADILQNDTTMILTDASGNTVTLVSDGAGAGTWSDSEGGSGNLTVFTMGDSAPDTGEFTTTQNQAQFIPFANLNVTFDSPAGVAGWNSLSGIASFHSPTHGGFEGTVNQPFTISHP